MALTKVRGSGLGTLGDGTANDTAIVFDGNAQDFHIGLDDSADSLTIGLGSALGTTSHMVFDANGHITKPLQPAFNVSPNAGSDNENLTTGGWVDIVWNTERFDQNGDFASNTFTAPVTGKYMLSALLRVVNMDTANTGVSYAFRTSNQDYIWHFEPDIIFSEDSGSHGLTLSLLVDMDASDTAKVSFYLNGGTAQTDVHEDSWFSGYLAC